MIAAARERGLPVLGELELAWRLLPNRFVAVTGTNGKTTTTELLGAIWREAGLPVALAGNVGTALSSLVGEVDPDATVDLRGVELPGRGLRGAGARHRAPAQHHRGPPRPARHLRGIPGREAAPVPQPDARAGGGRAAGRRGAGRGAAGGVRAAAAARERDPAPRRAQPRERQRRGGGGDRVGRPGGGRGARAPHVRRRAAPARGGGLGERRAVRERLEGHERVVRGARDRGVRRRRSRHPRRQPEGRRLRGTARRARLARRGGVPDRRGRGPARGGPRGDRPAAAIGRSGDRRRGRHPRPRGPARWSCCRPPARASTSFATTRSAATPSDR